MAQFDSRRQRLEMLQSVRQAFPPETLLAIRDAMMKKALEGDVGAAKLLLQWFGVALPRLLRM